MCLISYVPISILQTGLTINVQIRVKMQIYSEWVKITYISISILQTGPTTNVEVPCPTTAMPDAKV